jgi:hypothetical protein
MEKVDEDIPLEWDNRLACTFLWVCSALIGLAQSTLCRYYNWTGFASWSAQANDDNLMLPSIITALLMLPFLLLTYASLSKLYRGLRGGHKWKLAAGMQTSSAVFVVFYGWWCESVVLREMVPAPDAMWTPVGENHWSTFSSQHTQGDESRTFLKPATRRETLEVLIAPYLVVCMFLLHDMFVTVRSRGSAHSRRRSTLSILFDKYLGIWGQYFEVGVLGQQFKTVLLQSYTKLNVLGAAVVSLKVTRSPVVQLEIADEAAKAIYWLTVVALAINITYPPILLNCANQQVKL